MENFNVTSYRVKTKNKIKRYNLKSERFQYNEISKSAFEISNDMKLKQRSNLKLKEWQKYNYCNDDWCKKMLENVTNFHSKIRIENYDELSKEDFINKYERLSKPLIIKGATSNWRAMNRWNFEDLYNNYKEAKIKVGEDDDGYKLTMKFKYFLEYMIYNKDDSPLYLFESSIEKNKLLKNLIMDYEVPKYFTEDLFRLAGKDRRPPHRWFLIGPERSGTSIHIDPLQTSAWNASIKGHKLWLLLPPDVPKYIAKGKEVLLEKEDDEAIMYIRFIFPRIKEKYGSVINEILFIQNPGDLVFIPGGWWHVVVNLDDTIAITQNYCNSVNFPQVWEQVRKDRKKMSVKLLNKLRKLYPDLYDIARDLNSKDNFIMYDKYKMLNKKKGKDISQEKKENSSENSSSSSSLCTDEFL